MADTRSLPLWVDVGDGEDFASLMQRTAERLGVPTGRLLEHLAAETSDDLAYGVAISARTAEVFATQMRCRPEELRASTLSTFDGRAISLSASVLDDRQVLGADARREWALFRPTAACPACVDEFGFWRVSWRLCFSFACVRHERLLASACAACGVAFRGSQQKIAPEYPTAVPSPLRCMNSSRRVICGSPVVTTGQLAIHGSELAAQRTISHVLDSDQGQLFGERVGSLEWFRALRVVSSTVRRCGTVGVERSEASVVGGRTFGARGAFAPALRKPSSTAEAAAMLTTAVELMSEASSVQYSALVERSIQRDRAIEHPTWRPQAHSTPTQVDSVWSSVLLSSAKRPFGLRYSRPQRSMRPSCLPGSLRAPQLAVFSSSLDSISAERRSVFAAVLVVRMLADLEWRDAWLTLGYPASAWESWTTVSSYGPRKAGTAEDARQAAILLASSCGDWVEFDFGARRAALRDFELNKSSWEQIAAKHNVRVGSRQTESASAWAWQELTGNHVRFSPAFARGQKEGRSLRTVRKAYYHFVSSTSKDLQRDVVSTAAKAMGQAAHARPRSSDMREAQ